MREIDPGPETPDAGLARLRKADVWTGLVLAAVGAAMVAEALTFPLEGTYAGVRNAWYVSPALFPLIVAGGLCALSLGLVGKAVRDYRRLQPGGRVLGLRLPAMSGGAGDALLIACLLAMYIVGLVPRVDFAVATALFLAVFMGAYVIASVTGRALLVATLGVPSAAALAVALAGAWPAQRSAGQFRADGMVASVLVVAILVLAVFARGTERRRLVPVIASAVGAALILSVVFKYGLLVPLPREGVGVALLEQGDERPLRPVGLARRWAASTKSQPSPDRSSRSCPRRRTGSSSWGRASSGSSSARCRG